MMLLIFSSAYGVLIETYWNVKKDVVDAMQKTRQCINRNILECKVYDSGKRKGARKGY